MTKKQQNIIYKHSLSNRVELSDAYKKPSYDKQYAYNQCKKLFKELDGWDFKIIGRNMHVFSIGFYYKKDNQTWFHYETDVSYLDFEVK